jgi:hypothetical protein
MIWRGGTRYYSYKPHLNIGLFQRFLNFFFRVQHVYIISHVPLIIKNRIIQTSHS